MDCIIKTLCFPFKQSHTISFLQAIFLVYNISAIFFTQGSKVQFFNGIWHKVHKLFYFHVLSIKWSILQLQCHLSLLSLTLFDWKQKSKWFLILYHSVLTVYRRIIFSDYIVNTILFIFLLLVMLLTKMWDMLLNLSLLEDDTIDVHLVCIYLI